MLGKTLPTRYISSPSCFYNMHNRLVWFWGHLVLKRGEDASLCTRLILCGRWSCSCNRCCLLFKISWLKRERKIISSEETLEIMHQTRISHFFFNPETFPMSIIWSGWASFIKNAENLVVVTSYKPGNTVYLKWWASWHPVAANLADRGCVLRAAGDELWRMSMAGSVCGWQRDFSRTSYLALGGSFRACLRHLGGL